MQPELITPNPSPQPPQASYAMIKPEVSAMDSQNKNIQSGSGFVPPDGPPGGSWLDKVKSLKLQLVIGSLVIALIANLGVSAWLFKRVSNYTAQPVTTAGLKGDSTLYVDTQTKSVGIGASKPEGLQINSVVNQTARGAANVREGILSGDPTILFEDKTAQQWQIGSKNGSFQIGQPDNVLAVLDKGTLTDNKNLKVLGDTTLGDGSGNSVTLQAATLLTPNNLIIGNTALFIDSAHNSLAVGAKSANGYKLYVAGNVRVSSSIQADGQIVGPAGSASSPSISFANGTASGVFSPSPNIISVSAGGSETLRVQSGLVSTLNGSGLNVDGFLQAGGGGPAWKVVRYTGTLDGSGVGRVAHGISSASSRVIMAMAWYQNAAGTTKPLSVDYIDGSNIEVSGGSPGALWRGAIMYTADTAGW